jgi:hypothetical protein
MALDCSCFEHGLPFSSANLTLPASVASRSRIRRAKQHLLAELHMPQRDSRTFLDRKTKAGKQILRVERLLGPADGYSTTSPTFLNILPHTHQYTMHMVAPTRA